MSSEQQIQYATGASYGAYGPSQGDGFLARIDTSPIIQQIEMYLRGQVYTPYQTDNGITSIATPSGVPKCNDAGVQAIMGMVSGTVNSMCVMGNIEKEEWKVFVQRFEINLIKELYRNRVRWAIEKGGPRSIKIMVVGCVELFTSRLVGNKERESYQPTVKHHSTTEYKNSDQEQSSISMWGRK